MGSKRVSGWPAYRERRVAILPPIAIDSLGDVHDVLYGTPRLVARGLFVVELGMGINKALEVAVR